MTEHQNINQRLWRILKFSSLLIIVLISRIGYGQNYDANWILGNPTTPDVSGTIISFSENNNLEILPFQKEMRLEGSIAVMNNQEGHLIFYSNGCYIAGRNHEILMNGDSIGNGILESSFCESGGNPLTQGILALPSPGNTDQYYLIYTDISDPYSSNSNFFPLAPTTLYYSIISESANGGQGAVIEKNVAILADTFARGQIQATRHYNGQDWWVVFPKSHSNCYNIMLINEDGIDTSFVQCIGNHWGDKDASGQSVFSPDGTKYARFNYFYGLNIFDFNSQTGVFDVRSVIDFFDQDTFYRAGVAFSSNSKFLYTTSFNKIHQFDMNSPTIENSKVLVAELETPPDIFLTTSFNQSKLAPNGKIYIAGSNTHSYLHVIHHPNCQGINSNVEQYALEMPANNLNSLPNFPHYRNWNTTDSCDYTVNVVNNYMSDVIVNVTPNPVKQNIFIECKGQFSFPLSFRLYNSSGVLKKKMDFENTEIKIDITNLNNGLYIYNVKNKEGEIVKTGKIIKV